MKPSLLLVCEGNICRSPMAHGLFAHSLHGWHVASAGLHAVVGRPADETSVRLLRERGIDITAHRATQVSRAACLAADVVLVMEARHRRALGDLYPQAWGRVYPLCDSPARDVPDPYCQREPAFRRALELIERGVAQWLVRLQRLQRLQRMDALLR
jgi:protein-tyrosine phosphatase